MAARSPVLALCLLAFLVLPFTVAALTAGTGNTATLKQRQRTVAALDEQQQQQQQQQPVHVFRDAYGRLVEEPETAPVRRLDAVEFAHELDALYLNDAPAVRTRSARLSRKALRAEHRVPEHTAAASASSTGGRKRVISMTGF